MRSKPVKEESKDELDGDLSEKKTSNRSSEVEPCLTMDNGNDLDKKEANFGSDDSLTKGSGSLLESEKGDVYYSESKIDYSKSNSDKKTGFYRFRYECENKIRQKLGLTHGGYLAGLFLLSAVAFLLIAVIVLGACWPRVPHSQSFPICTESACLTSSALILSKLDREKRPCDDFYGFTCGEWSRKYSEPPSTRSRWNLEEETSLKISGMIREVISVLPHETRTNSITWKIRNFYDSCMSLDNIETDNERPLKNIINELGGWSVLRNFQVLSWDFSKTLVKLYEVYGVTPFFSVSVVPDPRNATRNIIEISASDLGLPDRSYYYREKTDKISSSYCRYMKDVARHLGATSIDANSFSDDMFYFERRLAEAMLYTTDVEDVRKHQIFTIDTLKILAPSIPLHEILDALFSKSNVNDDTEVLLPSLAYLTKISNIIATTDRSALNNFVIWNLVKKYLPYLSQNFRDIYSVYNKEMTGASNSIERWEFCIRTLESFMDVGVAAQIERTNWPSERQANEKIVRVIFEGVRHALRDSITRARWIDLELYKHYISKLDNVTLQVGFPEMYLALDYLEEYYSKMYVQKNNFFQNILYGVTFVKEERRRRYVSPKEEYRWLSSVASNSKVTFVPSINKVIVPQRLLYKPYFEYDYPLPVLYGTLGVQISRELVSSLLKYTGLYAANGSLVLPTGLVANLTLISTDHQLRCLTELTVENVNVTPEKANKTSLKTFTEISAVKQALKALKKVTEDGEHVHQAGLEDFEDEGLFYIVYGQSLFGQKTPQEEDKETTTSDSLSGRQMSEIIRLQMKSFAVAFGCSAPVTPCKHML